MKLNLAILVLENKLTDLADNPYIGVEDYMRSIKAALEILRIHNQEQSYDEIFFRETLSKL